MSVESHISQLETRHRTLESKLTEISTSPSTDQTQLAELKRQKLWLKDEINRLRNQDSVH